MADQQATIQMLEEEVLTAKYRAEMSCQSIAPDSQALQQLQLEN